MSEYTPPPVPAGFIEPTRRYPYGPRLTYEGRYGASVVAVLLGGYLLLNANLAQLALGLSGLASFPPEQTVILLLQYLFGIAVVVFGFAVAPGALGRRVIAIVVLLVLILVWTLFFTARITGQGVILPYASGFISAPSFIVPLALAAGWLIVRERPGVTYLFLLLSFLGGLIPFALLLGNAPSFAMQLLANPLALIIGAGIAWLARAVAAGIQGMRARSAYVDPPPPM